MLAEAFQLCGFFKVVLIAAALAQLLQPFPVNASCTSSDANGTRLACAGNSLLASAVNTSITGLSAAEADVACCSVSALRRRLCCMLHVNAGATAHVDICALLLMLPLHNSPSWHQPRAQAAMATALTWRAAASHLSQLQQTPALLAWRLLQPTPSAAR